MGFTKEELYEIEKQFDIHAGSTARALAEVISKLCFDGKPNKLSRKLFDDTVEIYDVSRMISVKARSMRGE